MNAEGCRSGRKPEPTEITALHCLTGPFCIDTGSCQRARTMVGEDFRLLVEGKRLERELASAALTPAQKRCWR